MKLAWTKKRGQWLASGVCDAGSYHATVQKPEQSPLGPICWWEIMFADGRRRSGGTYPAENSKAMVARSIDEEATKDRKKASAFLSAQLTAARLRRGT